MKHRHPTDLIPSLILGMLDAEEARVVREHLAQCASCQAEADLFRASLVDSTVDLGDLKPRPQVKHRLMEQVSAAIASAERRPTPLQRFGASFAVMGVVAVFMLAVLFLYSVNQQDPTVTPLVNPTPTLMPPVDPFEQFVNTPGTARHTLASGSFAPQAQAVLYIHQGDPRIGLVVEQLPPAPHGHTYQLWVAIGETQVSLGTFDPSDGHAEHFGAAPAPIDSYSDAMVTIEPTGGSPTPSTKIVWALKL